MPPSRHLTIHGHFYQPPRENPWLEAVETQDSAFPWHDWNARITTECYEPNASARILDEKDRIQRITNNYASISFNFGATLLSWLETAAPHTYEAILDADRISRQRFSGHGCAIAQAYNHIILPLADDRDKRTQVRWGMRDFEARFGRKAEAMWLPETAVDLASLEALAAEGVKFTILEPHQAARWRAIGADEEWHTGHLDPTLPYLCNLPSGRSIAIFFYDGPISRAVAFEQLLARGENFAHRLLGAFNEDRQHPELVNIATDGETYGHHHRYGEMALAYALQVIEARGDVHLTNYGAFLASHPPAFEVEIVERTAWSCSHGVERWRSDCGCNAGAEHGWNQQWRTPLRNALDWLRDHAAALFETEGARLLRDPWAARDAYIDVILDRSDVSVERFLAHHAREGASVVAILELLEMQRHAMLMYTSCGWFFNDVSGIETVQVLHYAARVIQLAERAGVSLEPEFAAQLEPARSNIPERGTARQIYEREVIPACLDLGRVAAHYAVLALFENFDDKEVLYCYEVRRRDFDVRKAGRARLAVGVVEVRSRITHEIAAFELAALHLGETELTGGVRAWRGDTNYPAVREELLQKMQPGGIPTVIRLLDMHFGDSPISIRSLFRDEQRRILNQLIVATLEEAESAFRQLRERYDPLMRFHMRLGVPVPKVLQTVAEFDLNREIRAHLEEDPPRLLEIQSRLREARAEGVAIDETTRMAFAAAIEHASELFGERPDDLDRLEALESLVSLVRDVDLWVDLRRAQNRYYRMRTAVRPVIEASHGGDRWLELFDSLGSKLKMTPAVALQT
jgi:alpha-amylase/alpha-mannosidase (GH57 family)